MRIRCTSLQDQQEILQSDILKKKLSNKAWLINAVLNIVFEFNQQKNKETQRKHDYNIARKFA